MKLTDDNVYRVEHKLIKDSLLWEAVDDEKLCHAMVAYVCGINDMAEAVVEYLKELR